MSSDHEIVRRGTADKAWKSSGTLGAWVNGLQDRIEELEEQLEVAHRQFTAGRQAEAELRQEWLDLKKRLEAALQMMEPLDDAVRDILDICHGWTRKLSDDEKLAAIERIAGAVISNPASGAE